MSFQAAGQYGSHRVTPKQGTMAISTSHGASPSPSTANADRYSRGAEARGVLKDKLSACNKSPNVATSRTHNGLEGVSGEGVPSASRLATRILQGMEDDAVLEVYLLCVRTDPGLRQHVLDAYNEEMANELAKRQAKEDNVVVDRRAALNLLSRKKKIHPELDPALNNNPLRGRLIGLFITTAALMGVFLQALIFNRYDTGRTVESMSVNGMIGPRIETLYALGGLSTNAVRNNGDTYRVFWAMWMHSGWLHIIFNVLCQLQYFYMFEPDWGFWRAFFSFWVPGVAANLVSATADPCSLTVGSSGGLFGLMGAMVAYCVEFWYTIPRPGCTLVFSLIVVAISLVVGFTGNTDNWCHMGGFIVGLLYGFATLTTLSVLEGDPQKKAQAVAHGEGFGENDARIKKKIHRAKVARQFKKKIQPQCKCGVREWVVRVISIVLLVIVFVVTSIALWGSYSFHPPGHIKFSSSDSCSCCYQNLQGLDDPKAAGVDFLCFAAQQRIDAWDMVWEDFCNLSVETLRVVGPKLKPLDALGRV